MSLKDKDLIIQILPPKLNFEGELSPSAVRVTHRKTKQSVVMDKGESVEDNKLQAIQLLSSILITK